jgi:putative PIN family toxin of toxin-antitoxin system
MKVFLDTNVLAAGFATRGLCSDIIRTVLESHELVSSLEILAELKRVLLKKFRVPAKKTEGILELVHSSSLISAPDRDATYPIADSDDIPHLSAAEQAGCNVFVTGDKELWTLSPLGKMRIISPRDFWDMISA